MMRPLAVFVAFVTLVSTPALAQGRRGGGRMGGMGGRGRASVPSSDQLDESTLVLLLSIRLNLTDAQQTQLHAVLDPAVAAAAPIAANLAANKDALFDAVKAGKSGEGLNALAEQGGTLTSQLLMLHEQTLAKIWAMLDARQQSEVDILMYNDLLRCLSSKPASSPAAPNAPAPAAMPAPAPVSPQ